jgi:hypothetical protein
MHGVSLGVNEAFFRGMDITISMWQSSGGGSDVAAAHMSGLAQEIEDWTLGLPALDQSIPTAFVE